VTLAQRGGEGGSGVLGRGLAFHDRPPERAGAVDLRRVDCPQRQPSSAKTTLPLYRSLPFVVIRRSLPRRGAPSETDKTDSASRVR
jgi:hypothetical protein